MRKILKKQEFIENKSRVINVKSKNCKYFKSNAHGITLIALIVLIIVILILAGVAISAITGGENVMRKAREAVDKTEQAVIDEQIRLNEISSKLLPEWDGTVATSFDRGNGDENNPFVIENAPQLAYFASVVNGESEPPLGSDNQPISATFEGKHVSIVNSINLGNREFTPIGMGEVLEDESNDFTKNFNGFLNGNNNVITGININKVNNAGVGLIGVLEINGMIQNLALHEGTITGLERNRRNSWFV